MLESVTMKEIAVATIEVDKVTAELIVNSLEHALSIMKMDFPKGKELEICTLMQLQSDFHSILSDFRE